MKDQEHAASPNPLKESKIRKGKLANTRKKQKNVNSDSRGEIASLTL